LKTPDNSFETNYEAVISLRDRLQDISKMNETDFAYQTAIQQITAQEQGEAQQLLTELHGCYILQSYPYLWNWYTVICTTILIMIGLAGWYMIKDGD
jgi:hypothetical protein